MSVGGLGSKLAVVLTASSLLLFASNTAIIGSYHVFLALVKGEFLPKIISPRSNGTFNTPHDRDRDRDARSCPGHLSEPR